MGGHMMKEFTIHQIKVNKKKIKGLYNVLSTKCARTQRAWLLGQLIASRQGEALQM